MWKKGVLNRQPTLVDYPNGELQRYTTPRHALSRHYRTRHIKGTYNCSINGVNVPFLLRSSKYTNKRQA